MKLSLSSVDLVTYVAAQLSAIFPDRTVRSRELAVHVARALDRTEHCFSHVRLKYFWAGDEPVFNHLHTDQYAVFLYFLSNSLFRDGEHRELAGKVYALNKALHGLDAYFEVELPSIFALQHPVGTVLGRATYGERLYVYQRCSVGSSVDGKYPTIGVGVVMYGGSSIIGDCNVGANSLFSVNAAVMDTDIPAGSVVFGSGPNLVIRPTRRRMADALFA